MNIRIPFITASIILGATIPAQPQSASAEFNKFRQQALSDYAGFKSRILEHYADFLNGEWHEFEPIWEKESPYTAPKPDSIPELAPDTKRESVATELPEPNFNDSALPGLDSALPGGSGAKILHADYEITNSETNMLGVARHENPLHSYFPSSPSQLPSASAPTTLAPSAQGMTAALLAKMSARKSNYERDALKIPDPDFAFGPLPNQIKTPDPSESGIVNRDVPDIDIPAGSIIFDFYGMKSYVPHTDFDIDSDLSELTQTGEFWNMLKLQKGAVETARQLFGLARNTGLNGYLTFRLTESYVNHRFKDKGQKSRMAAVHFLLSNMGYDVRLVQVNDMLSVMMPFDQKIVYGLMNVTANNNRKYTVLLPEGSDIDRSKGVSLMTYELPADAGGKTSDLRVTGLNLPLKPKAYRISNGILTLEGEVNENIRELFHHYPLMPNGDFASSWIDADMRESLVAQLKSQLNGMNYSTATNALLGLCHRGFRYKTDQQLHGFEKPYFMEENMLYDYNDCEDRAIFFSYMVWNALGLPCQLVQYPQHESTTVAVSEDIEGYYYNNGGTKYYSADPTYIGSNIGMVMSHFRNAVPSVDKQYPN